MAGIFIATGISRLSTTTWVDGYLVFKKRLKKSPAKFYCTYLVYFIFFAVAAVMLKKVFELFPFEGWMGFFAEVILCALIYNILFVLVFGMTKTFRNVVKMFFRRGRTV